MVVKSWFSTDVSLIPGRHPWKSLLSNGMIRVAQRPNLISLSNPTVDTLEKTAKALGVPTAELFK